MAALQRGYRHSFINSHRASTATMSTVQPSFYEEDQAEDMYEDEQFTSQFCRALYDYSAQDMSALSFHKGDIIEVLSQQPSGWWDGLLRDERGWFPSNYVTLISEEEADLAFSGSDFSNVDSRPSTAVPASMRDSMVDMSSVMGGNSTLQDDSLSWRDSFASSAMDDTNVSQSGWDAATSSSDFWMPQVASNGQIFYVNTKTGEQSRDLPAEADDDTPAPSSSQTSSRAGTSTGMGLAAVYNNPDAPVTAGFGVIRRTGTPEPWIKRLADDGQSYYYYNKEDGTVQWTRPEAPPKSDAEPTLRDQQATPREPLASNGYHRDSVYSDSSDIDPRDFGLPRSLSDFPLTADASRPDSMPLHGIEELTSAERIAQSLQQALASPPPESITELADLAKGSIRAVVDNVQAQGTHDGSDEHAIDNLIHNVVLTIRNLLYISAAPPGHIPSSVLPKDAKDTRSGSSQSPLKPAQRKVTATLSRLVLSARAMQYDSGPSVGDTLQRIGIDAEELERAMASYVQEVQRLEQTSIPESEDTKPSKKIHGTFSTANIGLGLLGAGAAASWKGFGFVPMEHYRDAPQRMLSLDLIDELSSMTSHLEDCFRILSTASQASNDSTFNQIRVCGRDTVAQLDAFLRLVSDVHVARHVDVDGIRHDSSSSSSAAYLETVEKARNLVRGLESSVQALYDDSSFLLTSVQLVRDWESRAQSRDQDAAYGTIDAVVMSLSANLKVVQQNLDGLLSLGHEQADMAQGDYTGSIEWRMSRLSMIETPSNGVQRALSPFEEDQEDVVDMELAFSRSGGAKPGPPSTTVYEDSIRQSMSSSQITDFSGTQESGNDTLIGRPSDLHDHDDDTGSLFDEPIRGPKPKRIRKADKLTHLLGDGIPGAVLAAVDAHLEPWYLRPNNNPDEIVLEDGAVKGGTLSALIERLTPHDHVADPNYIKAFLMTFKSFTNVGELFDLLVTRFQIQPPAELEPSELENWQKLKQTVVQMRVLNVIKALLSEQDTLEQDDMHVLPRVESFLRSPEGSQMGAAKLLLILADRAYKGDNPRMVPTIQGNPPASIPPKLKQGRLKLLDIDPSELARQLTLFESDLFQKIRPMECLQRAREQKTENVDNITHVIQTSNRIADWVAELVLSKEDSRKRASIVKHLISVADRCRMLNNFSTMAAITSGLNTPPIRRLKRTWEQVSQRYIAQFGACEMTIDSNKNFNKYRSLMATINPPCVPFIGVFLSTLQFIQDGNKDFLEGGVLINFKKRQMASEVISDIKRWQTVSFNFTPLPVVQNYISEALSQFNDTKASSDYFWELSLDREPKEREDEKMARLLQESGFL